MNNNLFQQMPFLRTSRTFPEKQPNLKEELEKAYIDIAKVVNQRIISIFSANKPAITGESWFLTTEKQQTLRQIYDVTSTASSIPHHIDISKIDRFTHCYGSYTDGTDWFGLIFASSTALTGQITFYIDADNINFVVDGAAPALTKGIIILQWMLK